MSANHPKIVLTGGGTAGHVTPNLALLPHLLEEGFEAAYVGSKTGIEKTILADLPELPYTGISTGKLRRYFDWKNFTDPFRVIRGYREAKRFLKQYKPDAVFSKGGYVSVPVVRAAHALRIPCIIHESDMTPGLANKLCFGSAEKICCNFPETVEMLPPGKAVLTGTPIREGLFHGDRRRGLAMCGFTEDKPVLMIMGGSQGAAAVNDAVRAHLDELLARFQIVHLCGKGKLDEALKDRAGYVQFEYISDELPDLFAAADLMLSRAGANAICEILALRKPNLLVPLPTGGSRGDQILNARSFEKLGYSMVVENAALEGCIVQKLDELYSGRERYEEAMAKSSQSEAIPIIMGLIREVTGKR